MYTDVPVKKIVLTQIQKQSHFFNYKLVHSKNVLFG